MLDDFDRKILDLVQHNNLLTHSEIGENVFLSPSSVRRRLAKLREDGVIQADVSIVDPAPSMVTVVVAVSFQEEGAKKYREFEQRMIDSPEVSQCYYVAGEMDFILIVHASDLKTYEEWGDRMLMADPGIRRYDSHIVWSRVKFSPALQTKDLS